MTTIYFMRHAQSHPSINLNNGAWPLSHRVREQAKALPDLLQPLVIEQLFSGNMLDVFVSSIFPYFFYPLDRNERHPG